jgi:hypothetical protein
MFAPCPPKEKGEHCARLLSFPETHPPFSFLCCRQVVYNFGYIINNGLCYMTIFVLIFVDEQKIHAVDKLLTFGTCPSFREFDNVIDNSIINLAILETITEIAFG